MYDGECEEGLRRDTVVGIMMREEKRALVKEACPQSRGEEGEEGKSRVGQAVQLNLTWFGGLRALLAIIPALFSFHRHPCSSKMLSI